MKHLAPFFLTLVVACSSSPTAPITDSGPNDVGTTDQGTSDRGEDATDGGSVGRDVSVGPDIPVADGGRPASPVRNRERCDGSFITNQSDTCQLGFSTSNAVPFISMEVNPQNAASAHWTVRVDLVAETVQLDRPNAGQGPMTVTVDVIDFDPSFATVKSAPLSLADGVMSTQVSFTSNFNDADTFFLTSWRMDGDGPAAAAAIRIQDPPPISDQLLLSRDNGAGAVSGKVWAVSSVDGSFSVSRQTRGNGIAALQFPVPEPARTLGLFTWSAAGATPNGPNMGCSMVGSNFECFDPVTDFVTVNAQLVQFRDASVEHLSTSTDQSAVTIPTMASAPIATTGSLSISGIIGCDIVAPSSIDRCLMRLSVDGNNIEATRNEGIRQVNLGVQAISF